MFGNNAGVDKSVQCRGSPQEAALFDKVMAGLNGSAFLPAAEGAAAAAAGGALPSISGFCCRRQKECGGGSINAHVA